MLATRQIASRIHLCCRHGRRGDVYVARFAAVLMAGADSVRIVNIMSI